MAQEAQWRAGAAHAASSAAAAAEALAAHNMFPRPAMGCRGGGANGSRCGSMDLGSRRSSGDHSSRRSSTEAAAAAPRRGSLDAHLPRPGGLVSSRRNSCEWGDHLSNSSRRSSLEETLQLGGRNPLLSTPGSMLACSPGASSSAACRTPAQGRDYSAAGYMTSSSAKSSASTVAVSSSPPVAVAGPGGVRLAASPGSAGMQAMRGVTVTPLGLPARSTGALASSVSACAPSVMGMGPPPPAVAPVEPLGWACDRGVLSDTSNLLVVSAGMAPMSVSVSNALAAPQHSSYQQQQRRCSNEDVALTPCGYPGDTLVLSDMGGDWGQAMGSCWDVDSLATSAASLLVLDDTLLAAHNSANLLPNPLELAAGAPAVSGLPALVGSSSTGAAAAAALGGGAPQGSLVGLEEMAEEVEMLQVPLTPQQARLVAGNMAAISSASGARLALSPAAGTHSLLLTLTGSLGQLLEARQLVKALVAPSPAAWMG